MAGQSSFQLTSRSLTNSPFLMLGVSASADMAEINRVGKELASRARLADGDDAKVQQIENAVEELRDPVERFRWGVLWLRLSKDEATHYRRDATLASLASDPTTDGTEAFNRIMEGQSRALMDHNLGLLRLLRAEASTRKAQADTPDDIDDDLECVPMWANAFDLLSKSFSSAEFWTWQRNFAESIEDARLTSDIVARMQRDTARLVLSLPAQTIQTALLRGHAKVAIAFVNVIRASGFDADTIESLLSEIYQPLADRVERSVDGLSNKLKASPEEVKGLFAEFESDVLPDVRVMLAVGDLPGYAEEHARDTSAEFLRSLGIAAWNVSDDGDLGAIALRVAEEIVNSASLGAKLKGDRSKLVEIRAAQEQAAKDGNCAFCGEAKCSRADSYDMAMYKVTDRIGNRVRYQTATVPVPRCADCKHYHDRVNRCLFWTFVCLFVGTVIWFLATEELPRDWIFIGRLIAGVAAGFFGGAFVTFVIGQLVNLFGPAATWKARSHPFVKSIKAEGFKFGEKPPKT